MSKVEAFKLAFSWPDGAGEGVRLFTEVHRN